MWHTLALVTETADTYFEDYPEDNKEEKDKIISRWHNKMQKLGIEQSLSNADGIIKYSIIDFGNNTSTVYEAETVVSHSITAY